MLIVNQLLNWHLRKRIPQLRDAWKNPQAYQQKIFKNLLQTAQNTVWGREHGYADIKNLNTYQTRVPVSDYDNLEPYILSMLEGKSDVLWKGLVRNFSKSSGTTRSKSKFIPVPEENLQGCHLKSALDNSAWWFENQPNTRWFVNSKGLGMGGSWAVHTQNPRIVVGDVSALLMQNMPFYARWFLTPDLETALLPNWEEKIARMLKIIQNQNVTSISGVPTWTLLLLQQLLDFTGKKDCSEIFPNFEVYMHGGVSFEPYRAQFKALFPNPKVQYRENYNASEGFFASQLFAEDDDMYLHLDSGIFYEFLPYPSTNPSPTPLPIEEVEVGQVYALVISTNGGLWRYLIGDTIVFTSTFPHKIKVVGRTQQFLNVFGEEVMVANTDKALAMTCEATQASITDYTVAPIFIQKEQKGGHQWLIEFQNPPQKIEAFAQLLDENLQKINSDYEAKRAGSLALEALRMDVLPQGSFERWLKSKGKWGGQHKVPRLSNDRKIVEEILSK